MFHVFRALAIAGALLSALGIGSAYAYAPPTPQQLISKAAPQIAPPAPPESACKGENAECTVNSSEKACCPGLVCVPDNPSSGNGKCHVPAPPPTDTPIPPTATEVPPTATEVPPTATEVPPTATSEPPTATSEPPTATSEPPTATSEAPTATSEAPTATSEAPTATTAPPATNTPGAEPTKTPIVVPTNPPSGCSPPKHLDDEGNCVSPKPINPPMCDFQRNPHCIQWAKSHNWPPITGFWDSPLAFPLTGSGLGFILFGLAGMVITKPRRED